MDSYEARLDRIESQRSTDGLTVLFQPIRSLSFSDLFSFPGVYVPMSPKIYSAASYGKKGCVEIIRSDGNPMACLKSDQGDSVLHLAAGCGHVKLVASILSESPSLLLELDSKDQLPLHVAAHAGHVGVVKALIVIIKSVSDALSAEDKERLNLYVWKDTNGDTPLHLALRVINIVTSTCLVNANQQASFLPNEDGVTPFYMAIEAGMVSLVNKMLKPTNNGGPDLQLRAKKCLLLHTALKGRNTDVLDIILKKYPSLEDERDEEGNTCLSFGASIGFFEGVRTLLRRSRKSVYISNNDGSFPIHIAAEKGHTNVVIIILKYCPESIYLLNKKAQNMLHIASEFGKVSFVLFSYLWRSSCLDNLMGKQDVDGNTPSHIATINWHHRTLFYILNNYRGKCMYIRNKKGLTPLDIAESNLQSTYIYRERMTQMVLKINRISKRDYKNNMFKIKMMTPTGAPAVEGAQTAKDTPAVDNKEHYVNTLLLVATLVATVTFAAGFTIPGGFNSSGPNLGSATLTNDVKLICFMVFDVLAMLSSILTIVILIWGQLGDPALVQKSLDYALPSLFISLLCMPVGFYCGVYIAFAHVKGVLIFLNVLFGIFVILILKFLGPHVILLVPLIARVVGLLINMSAAYVVSYKRALDL